MAYHGTGLKDVTTAAAATTGSVYHFFPGGKSELAEALLRETGEAYRRLFELIADEAATVVAALEGAFVLARTARDADVVRRTGAHMSAMVTQAIADARPAPARYR